MTDDCNGQCEFDVRELAMRLVVGRHVAEEILEDSFWRLILDTNEKRRELVDLVAEVLDAWTPPQLDGLSDALVSGWISQQKARVLMRLYEPYLSKRDARSLSYPHRLHERREA